MLCHIYRHHHAVIGQRQADGTLAAEILTSLLNGSNSSEVERLKSEHPGEEEVALNGRVLGLIAVFRGMFPFIKIMCLSDIVDLVQQ